MSFYLKRAFFMFGVALAALGTAVEPVLAQTAAVNEEECTTREQCEALLKQYEIQLAQDEADIQKTAYQKKTLQDQIAYLRKKTENLSVKINQSNVVITDLKLQINDTKKSVDDTIQRIIVAQSNLAETLRSINEEDGKSLAEILFAETELSDFFDNVVYLENLNSRSEEILKEIEGLKIYLEDQKVGLEGEKGDLEKQVKVQVLEKQAHETNKKEQEKTLKMTEAEYQKSLADKSKTAQKVAQIKSRIFELAGLGATAAPNFEEAYKIAKAVGLMLNVRPAFLLAILTQESNIGKNVGQCYLKNSTTGAGINIRTGASMAKVMNPSRDVMPFLSIVQDTGRDPYATQVSCPMSFGWGGAMGPAQFIPATWISYRDRIKALTGRPADPWNINDAFMAAGLYASDYGATSKTYNGEWRAAMIYFAGSVNTKYRFYGDNVCAIAASYADDIAAIEGQ